MKPNKIEQRGWSKNLKNKSTDITNGFFYIKSEGKTKDNSRVENGNLVI